MTTGNPACDRRGDTGATVERNLPMDYSGRTVDHYFWIQNAHLPERIGTIHLAVDNCLQCHTLNEKRNMLTIGM